MEFQAVILLSSVFVLLRRWLRLTMDLYVLSPRIKSCPLLPRVSIPSIYMVTPATLPLPMVDARLGHLQRETKPLQAPDERPPQVV